MRENRTETLQVKPQGKRSYQWLDRNFHPLGEGSAEELAQSFEPGVRVSLLIPAQDVLIERVEFDEAERKLLRQTVRYSLEPELSDDIDETHFALGEPGDSWVDVAIVNREQLSQWLEPLLEQEIRLQGAYPEQLMIPWRPQTWTIIGRDRDYLVRHGENGGFAVTQENLGVALDLLLQQQGTNEQPLPLELRIGGTCEGRGRLLSCIPPLLQGSCQWLQTGCQELDSIEENHREWYEEYPINLLQGEFATPLPWAKWWRQWRAVAAIGLLAVGLQLFSGFVINQSLRQEITALRQEIEQTYRDVVPKGKLVDAQKQLQRRVKALQGEAGSGFIRIYRGVADAVESVDGVSMRSMSYSDKQGEMRITLIAPSFNDIERLRAAIDGGDISAELSGISNEQGKTRARLIVKG